MGKTAATSKASRKNQTTIPARVRKALGVAKGDTLLWTIEDGKVSIQIINRVQIDWAKTAEMSLLEWTPEDEAAAQAEEHHQEKKQQTKSQMKQQGTKAIPEYDPNQVEMLFDEKATLETAEAEA